MLQANEEEASESISNLPDHDMQQALYSDLRKKRLMEEEEFLTRMLREKMRIDIRTNTTIKDLDHYIALMDIRADKTREKFSKTTNASKAYVMECDIGDMESITEMLKKKK